MDIIRTSSLGHAYGDTVALRGLDLSIPGGINGLVGANGAGKTTLMKILLGILDPTAGNAEVLGDRVDLEKATVRSKVGYMPEGDCLPRQQSAADFISYAAELAGIPATAARQRASDVLTLVGLGEERFRYLGDYSTGMKQRAKLAQAIVHHPDLVFLDEPTAGLDPAGRDEMLDLIRRIGGFGINVLTSSHVLTDIEQTCDFVVMLDAGTVLRQGSITGIVTQTTVDVEVQGASDTLAQALRNAGATVLVDGRRLEVAFDQGDPFDLIRDQLIATGTGLRRMSARSSSLEDVYLGGA
ncbi:MAG: ABC transporter ATP-binding protein [Acidimicrobiia bacterium]|nr:ABC transporter ATP-binding protein [Acidimicrobiia bacterium]NNF69233.1 ABC transporter ATP-binding protein [Acidimicrobiia bacterium]